MTDESHTASLPTRDRLNLETATIAWSELQRFFAQGRLMVVGRDLDLVDTAADFVDDHEAAVREKLEAGQVRAASVEDARRWQDEDAVLWAVVTAPWILVQETQQAES